MTKNQEHRISFKGAMNLGFSYPCLKVQNRKNGGLIMVHGQGPRTFKLYSDKNDQVVKVVLTEGEYTETWTR